MNDLDLNNSLHHGGETLYDWMVRLADQWLSLNHDHPSPDTVAQWESNEPTVVSAWMGSAYVLMLIPPSEFRSACTNTQRIPPFQLRNSDDTWIFNDIPGTFNVPEHFATYDAAYQHAVIVAALQNDDIQIINAFGNTCGSAPPDTDADPGLNHSP